MIYVEAPTPYYDLMPDGAEDWPRVFLAGGITGCRDWQADVAHIFAPFKMVVMNPRRDTFDVTDPTASETQITWEFNHLAAADVIMFWFSHETVQPITLFELGSWLHSETSLVVGVDPRYSRAADVRIQSSLVRGTDFDIHSTLRDTAWAVLRDLDLTPADRDDRPEGQGWVQFGTHAGPGRCEYQGKFEFGPNGEDGLPDWERHADHSECAYA